MRGFAKAMFFMTLIAATLSGAAFAQEKDAKGKGALPDYCFDSGITEAQATRLAAMKGKSLPADLLSDLEWRTGNRKNLGASRGKVVALQFWGLGSPSKRSWLQRIAQCDQKFHDDDLVVVAIHPNGAPMELEKARDFIERQIIPVTIAIDSKGSLTELFQAQDRPINILIDRQGAVHYYGLTGRGLDIAIQDLVDREFDADAPPPPLFEMSNDGDDDDLAQALDGVFPVFSNEVDARNDLRGKKAPRLEVEEWLTAAPNLRNKVLVVDFWATRCGPCVASIPHLNALAEKFGNDIAVVGLTAESVGTVRGFMRNHEMKYAVAVDQKRRMSDAVGVRFIPHMLVISPDGVVRFQGMPQDLTEDGLAQIIRASKG